MTPVKRALQGLMAAVLLAPSAHAQDEAADGDQQTLYQVEVLIFRHLDQSRTTTEIPQLVEPEIADLLDQQLPRLGTDPQAMAPIDDMLMDEAEELWRPVSGRRFMDADVQRLERLDAYEVISHLAWIQAAPDVAVAEGIDIALLGAPAELRGQLKLYRKRYLHLAVDVALDEAVPQTLLFPAPEQAAPAIVDSRRMRLGRTVYFDQPRFGVLTVVNKVAAKPN